MPAAALRPRTATEIVDAAFSLLRRHYAQLLALSAVGMLPVLLLGVVAPATPFLVYNVLYNILFGICSSFAEAAIVVAVSEGYLGQGVESGAALRQAWSRVGSVFGAGILKSIAIGIGFILLIVPGIIFFAWFFAAEQAVVLEKMDAGESLTRSRDLARGHVKRILLTLGLVWVIFFALLMGVTAGFAFITPSEAIATLLGNVFFVVMYPMVAVVATLLYYDIRIRKEGYDIELMTKELAAPAKEPVRAAP